MKIGRNDLCPCGSGKKYKRCCIGEAGTIQSALADDLSQILAMNPELTIDELNVVAEQKTFERNNAPLDDFCGLSPAQMSNWLYAPFNQIDGVAFCVPEDFSGSPVMCYLSLILDEIIAQGGSINATARGNLPTTIVKQASALLPTFAVSQYEKQLSISEFAGSAEGKFNALHYARALAELAGIIYLKSGRLYARKAFLKKYQEQGIGSCFLPMLEVAVNEFNWGYFDGWPEDFDLRTFWVFMLWRLQKHGSFSALVDELRVAFPDLVSQLHEEKYQSSRSKFENIVKVRFIERFLQFWGFVIVDPLRVKDGVPIEPKVTLLPLCSQVFRFGR